MNRFKCSPCGSEKYEIFLKNGEDFEYGVKGKFGLFRCTFCNLVSLFPRPSLKQLLSFYPESYHSYNVPVSKITRFFVYLGLKQQAKKFTTLIGKKGKILDVGCANGKQFDVLNKFGNWQFVGIDFNDKIVKKGRKEGYEIYATTLEKFDYPKESFDLVIMDHLLEHVANLIETLDSASRLLKKGGYLVGAVPNINSLDRIFFGRFWGGYHLPRHVWHFIPQTLSGVLEKAGFKVIKITYELHTGHWALSVQNFLQSKKITKTRIRQGRTFYYPLLIGLLIPINLIQKLFRCTGVISFVAQKADK